MTCPRQLATYCTVTSWLADRPHPGLALASIEESDLPELADAALGSANLNIHYVP